ncbi:hypothetical protein DFP92_11783 [Yoonia sediminilitoris]|uniref:Uncharacterized protein n=1 Tax=Yoonia sediminilitoris TaxID=1286148 RepID=A0A2T6K7S9_9RHOB|nr:hypothetical protein C8N45_11783 [Yoonia sediminilitoris]RCW90489.1 hypothetical protein DFP92_11783 [Yoonia sediminilitoris]
MLTESTYQVIYGKYDAYMQFMHYNSLLLTTIVAMEVIFLKRRRKPNFAFR